MTALRFRPGRRMRVRHSGATRPFGLHPRIRSIIPNRGAAGVSTPVTLTGVNFGDVTAVTLGGSPIAFSIVNDTTITLTVPPGTPGTSVNIALENPEGTGTARFSYDPILLPIISTISPATGPTTGGTGVTISGSNFTGVTSVSWGGTNLSVIPAPTAPTVGNVSPASGGPGDTVTITGSGFMPAPGYYFISASQIGVITPARAAGPVNVTVTTGTGTTATAGTFTYTTPAVAPIVSSISPTSGSAGDTVTITGSGFLS